MNIKTIIANVDKTAAAKKVVRFATAVSVGKSVQNVVRNNIPTSENRIVNFAVDAACYVGGSVAAGYVLEHLGDYSDQQIDTLLAPFQLADVQDDEDHEVITGTVL